MERHDEKCCWPCPPDNCCLSCEHYWQSMRDQGFWEDGVGWTDKAMKEMGK
jgi:hypothetical protein